VCFVSFSLLTLRRVKCAKSGVEGVGSSYVQAISADGRYAVFQSNAANLISGDTNSAFDSFVRDLTRTGVQQLSGVVISNKVSAKVTLDLVQKYRAELLDYRSKIGASTSRIGTFINTLQSSTILTTNPPPHALLTPTSPKKVQNQSLRESDKK
jgi:hypothetical protein